MRLKTLFMMMALAIPAAPARAADDDVPYWASITADVAYMRVGPSNTYRIDWIYKRRNLPVQVLRREGPWRLVRDPDGTEGWMRDLLLSRQRAAIVTEGDPIELRARPSAGSPMLWRAQAGVIGLLGECQAGWCEFDATGHRGFAPEDRLWGAGEP